MAAGELCGFRILVVLCGFYGSTRHKPSAIWRKATTWFSTVCLSVDTRT